MQRNWSHDVDAAPIGWLLYVSIDPEDVPRGVRDAETKGFRLADGWYVLDAEQRRVPVRSVTKWARIEYEAD